MHAQEDFEKAAEEAKTLPNAVTDAEKASLRAMWYSWMPPLSRV